MRFAFLGKCIHQYTLKEEKMRKIFLTTISILSLVTMVSVNPTVAGEKYIVFEMGESGFAFTIPPKIRIIATYVGVGVAS